ncbi:uncharacterized protein LOC143858838 [Tasmannia lanceolata]|uniref:uncharacterized protein LOC143858838 n=1 Tax=Tasmannia lanceolata TaxID=3420 RepID=UPI00406289BC
MGCLQGEAVYNWLLEYLNVSVVGGKYLGGCSLTLQVWLFEHTKLWIPTNPDACPRLLKWNSKGNESKKYSMIEHGKIDKSEVVVTLTPREDELRYIPEQEPEEEGIIGQGEPLWQSPTVPALTGTHAFEGRDTVVEEGGQEGGEEASEDRRIKREWEKIGEAWENIKKERVHNEEEKERLRRVRVEMEAEKENLRIQIAAERKIIQKKREAMRRQEGDQAEMEKEELRKDGEKRREEEDMETTDIVSGGLTMETSNIVSGGLAMEVINVMSQGEDVGFVNEAVVTGASDIVTILDSPEGKTKRTEKLGSIERRVKNQTRDRKPSYAKNSPYTVPPVTKKKSERAMKKVTRRRTDLIQKLKKQNQSRIPMTVEGVKVLAEDLETLWNLKGVLSGQVLDVYGKYLCASSNALTGRIVYIPSSVHGYKTSGRDSMDGKNKLDFDRLANELLHRTLDHLPLEDIGMLLVPCCQDFHCSCGC